MMGRLARTLGRAAIEGVGRVAGRVQSTRSLPADVLEGDEEYLVVFDAPGAAMSDVQVRFVDDEVLVRVERFRDPHEGYEMVFPGRGLSLDGRVTLPDGARVSPADATAHLTDRGTLEVHLPKRAGRPADASTVEDPTAAEEAADAGETPDAE